jgi:7-cyano-7-deazaguanine synthase in queuosine biosynthesis
MVIDTSVNGGNARSAWRLLEGELMMQIPDSARDVLDLAEAVYIADRCTERTDKGTSSLRVIRITVPLRRPELFREAELSELMRCLSLDSVSFNIVKRKREKNPNTPSSQSYDNDLVCLVSGGVDSFGGLVDACKNDMDPVAISHYTSDSTIPSRVVESTRSNYDVSIPHMKIGTLTNKGGSLSSLDKEPSMRLRSFLYLSLGAATAMTLDIDKIVMAENGIMSPGIPFSPARIGPFTTRTAHPVYMKAFQDWFSRVGQCHIRISNPFEYRTKAEVLSLIEKEHMELTLGKTSSCFKLQWARRKGKGHCGYCVPCIIRRSAFLTQGIEDSDDSRGYFHDCYNFDGLPESGKVDMMDLTTFARNMSQGSQASLVLRYVDLLDLQDDQRIEKTIKTLKRFSNELIDVLSANAAEGTKRILGVT